MKRFILVLFLVVLWIAPSTSPAQDNRCSAVVQDALAVTDASCEATGRNQACYGNVQLEAVTRPGFDDIRFTRQGDLADVAALSTLELSSMNTEANEWGVALMRIQANLPDTLPGQNVLFLLFGDVEIENAVTSNAEPVRFDVTTTGNVNIRSGPSTNDEIIGGLAGGERVTASGRLADGSWLQLDLSNGSVGWVSAPLVTTDGDISLLNIVEPEAPTPQYRPMQAFYFRSGLGDALCEEAPDSGILIQTPEGVGEITLVVNEVNIALSSTVYLQAQSPGELTINGIENQARISAFGVTQTAVEGTRVRVPLDENRAASGPPEEPEPYDFERLQALPLQNLDRSIALPPARTPENLLSATPTSPSDSQNAYSDSVDDVFACDTQAAANDPEADIVRLEAERTADGGLQAKVYLQQPLVNDYSFAVLLVVMFEGISTPYFYIWEVHDGEFRIGQVDGETGRMLISSPELRIEHNREAGYISFSPPVVYLPERRIVQIGARSYHTPGEEMQPQPTYCDFAGLYNFVDLDID